MSYAKALYTEIRDRLRSELPAIGTLTRFNNQFEQMEESQVLELPAVLIEIAETSWANTSKFQQSGTAIVRIHIGQELYGDFTDGSEFESKALSTFDLPQSIYLALQGFSGSCFSSMTRINSFIDSSYDHLTVDQIEFTTSISDRSADPDNTGTLLSPSPGLETPGEIADEVTGKPVGPVVIIAPPSVL